MSIPLIFDIVLCLLLVGAALSAVAVRDLFGAVVFFIVYGLFVAIAWVRLGAVDVALAEAAIGAGLTGVLLVRAAGRLQDGSDRGGTGGVRSMPAGRAKPVPMLACALVSGALAWIALDGGIGESDLREQVERNLGQTGVQNPVTAVLLNYRGYDTLLETLVLLTSLVGVWSLTVDRFWGGPPGVREHARPEGVLASFGRVLPPVGFMVGIHLFWAGADAPGGAFQAGTVLAAVWILLVMADVTDAPPVSSARLRMAVAFGPLLFLAIASAGVAAGTFLAYPPAYAKAIILAAEAGLTFSIAAILGLLVMGPPRRVE